MADFFKEKNEYPSKKLSDPAESSLELSGDAGFFTTPKSRRSKTEFHDPFSDPNLFLAKKIKLQMLQSDTTEWSRKIETHVIAAILPEFTRKFPSYKLGINIIKKTWQKVAYYLGQIEKKHQALNPNGTLHLPFIIRENLRFLLEKQSDRVVHPLGLAHQLALKVSDCIATLDGEFVPLGELTGQITLLQRHLIPKEEISKPYLQDHYTELDKWIVEVQLELINDHPNLSASLLREAVEEHIQKTVSLASVKNLTLSAFALTAYQLYPSTSFHNFSTSDKNRLLGFIRSEVREKLEPNFNERHVFQFIRKILFLAKISQKMDKNLAQNQLEAALHYVFSLSTDCLDTTMPTIQEEVYELIQQELVTLKEKKIEQNIPHAVAALLDSFEEIENEPLLGKILQEDLEIVIWKVLEEEKGFISGLSSPKQEILQRLIAREIFHSKMPSLSEAVREVCIKLKKRSKIGTEKLAARSHLWSIQNDLPYGWIHLDTRDKYYAFIKKCVKETPGLTFAEIARESSYKYVKLHSSLHPWREELEKYFLFLLKYMWYNENRSSHSSTFERLILWHEHELLSHRQAMFPDLVQSTLIDTLKNLVPYLPVEESHVTSVIQPT
ncbi:MAG: hypothetical protein A3F09_03945 [Chlamydiae bacterium RIFCSPHIGHO2_12_FULL_49_11]|nr:MAG: hypothetical protein A3F09_03945 [Chlamydiae bacterium RIFCSPHIGHO2_12_FULL_49_11]